MKAPTARQLAILAAYVVEGSHKGAAYRLGISESTVRNQVSRMNERIGAVSTAHAVYVLHDALVPLIGAEAA